MRRLFIITASMVLTLAWLVQCGGPSKTASYLKPGKNLYEQGEYEKAITELKSRLEEHPESADLRYYLGLSYLETGEFEQALTQYFQAAKLDTNTRMDSIYASGFTGYAGQLKDEGQYKTAISWADTAINLDRQNSRAYYVKYMSRGLMMYEHADRWGLWDAIVVFGKAAQVQPDEPMPYYYTAKAYQKKNDKDFENAISAYEKALKRNPRPAIREEIESNLKELRRRKKLYEDFWGE